MYSQTLLDGHIQNLKSEHKAIVLIVDDEHTIRKLLKHILEIEGYMCRVADSAQEAVRILSKDKVDLVVSDVVMPGMSGIQLLEHIKNNHPEVAILMMTGNGDRNNAEAAISKGACGYLFKPFQKRQVLINVKEALRRRQTELQNQFRVENLQHVIEDQSQNLTLANNKLEKTLKDVIKAMSLAIESRDPYTAGHQLRVMELAMRIASKLNFTNQSIENLGMAAIIHDIGKIAVPSEILSKPARLTPAELNIIKEHPTTGYKILNEITFPYPLAEMVYQHHERLDGSGYPLGLNGDRILLEAKILAVADVVESMASHRPYRPSLGINAALEEISINKGKLFDSNVVDACCDLFEKMEFAF